MSERIDKNQVLPIQNMDSIMQNLETGVAELLPVNGIRNIWNHVKIP